MSPRPRLLRLFWASFRAERSETMFFGRTQSKRIHQQLKVGITRALRLRSSWRFAPLVTLLRAKIKICNPNLDAN